MQRLTMELAKSDSIGKGLFLEDDLTAFRQEDLFDTLAMSSLRRVYRCRLEQHDKIASTKRLNPCAE